MYGIINHRCQGWRLERTGFVYRDVQTLMREIYDGDTVYEIPSGKAVLVTMPQTFSVPIVGLGEPKGGR